MAGEGQGPARERYLVSTICRGSRPGEPSGHLHIVDLEQGVQGSCPVPPSEHLHREPNPRGGIRGGRGLATDGDTVYVANGSSVLRFDRGWHRLAEIGHPWCGNVHDIALDDDRLWVCSTANDALAAFDPAGRLTDLVDLRPAAGTGRRRLALRGCRRLSGSRRDTPWRRATFCMPMVSLSTRTAHRWFRSVGRRPRAMSAAAG